MPIICALDNYLVNNVYINGVGHFKHGAHYLCVVEIARHQQRRAGPVLCDNLQMKIREIMAT